MEIKNSEQDNWAAHRLMVLKALDSIEDQVAELRKDISEVKTAVTVMKTQSAMVGVIIGIIVSAAVTIFINLIAKH